VRRYMQKSKDALWENILNLKKRNYYVILIVDFMHEDLI